MNAMYRQLDLKASAGLAPSMLVRLLKMDDSYKLIVCLTLILYPHICAVYARSKATC